MNKKLICRIATGLMISAGSTFAETKAEVTPAVATISAEEIAAIPSNDEILQRLIALENKEKETSAADWAEKIKIKGDLRYRFEQVEQDDSTSKNRQRLRIRLGAYAAVNDFTQAGIRIRSNQGANSGNETIGSQFDAKGTYFDLAYITVAPQDAKYGSATVGKMKYPWNVTTDMIWDSDVNPEGAAYTYATSLDKTGVFGSAGYFKVEETSSTHDLNLASAQVGITQPLGEKSKFTGGASFFYYDNAEDFGAPVDYEIAELFGDIGFKDLLPVPFKLYGNYVNNTDISTDNEGFCGGIKFGDAKKGKWEAKIDFRRLEANAAPAQFADSDFAGGGTDVEGARIKAAYNLGKHLQFGVTFISGETISTGTKTDTLHADLSAAF